MIVVGSKPAVADAPNLQGNQKQRPDSIVEKKPPPQWRGAVGQEQWGALRWSLLEHHRETNYVHQGTVFFIPGMGRIQFRNLTHRQLHQLVFRLQPIILIVAFYPTPLNIQSIGADRDFCMSW